MADQKITDLTEIYNYELADGDLFEVVDVSDTSGPNAGAGGENKRITRAELVAGLATRQSWDGTASTAFSDNSRYVGLTAALSAGRTLRLPLASAVPAGAMLTFADEIGGITASFNVTIRVVSGSSDTIDGFFDAAGSPTPTAAQVQYLRLRAAYSSASLMSDGTSKWSIVNIKPAMDIQTFTANGTWQRPLGFTQARIILFGGGGGGGSGRRGTSGDAYGGGGGGAGGVTVVDVPLSDLPNATYTVTVGASAAGGAARTTTNNGANATAGNTTWFSASTLWTAAGGGAGSGGTTTSGDSGNGGAGMVPGATGGAQGTMPTPVISPGSGGSGGVFAGGVGVGGVQGGNSSGGVGTNSVGLAGGTAGTNAPSAGGAGTAPTTISAGLIAGGAGGGGGGAPAISGAASAGGAGAAPGGGGGGGGGTNNANSGAGGAGARGAAIIICW